MVVEIITELQGSGQWCKYRYTYYKAKKEMRVSRNRRNSIWSIKV